MLEENEASIEKWYFEYEGGEPLKTFLCEKIVLKGQTTDCLKEKLKGETESDVPKITTDKPNENRKQNDKVRDKTEKTEL